MAVSQIIKHGLPQPYDETPVAATGFTDMY